ncbi:MAG TPA: hypothetical protein VD861_05565 [Pyrinomonadaceae bacterium]|nr:hypothetical protein [Pyrinomonadaceae bacterium]
MDKARRVTASAAAFVLICFFLPWVQVSCGGAEDTASGYDLARGGDRLLWLVPLLMLAVILLWLTRDWKRMPTVFALASTAGGLISAYLMNLERRDAENLAVARTTGWFWLGFFSSLVVVISALVFYLKRAKPT